jgi:hypothetical protein
MKIAWLALLLLGSGTILAAQFQGTTTAYGKEQCLVLNRFGADSGAHYRSKDDDQEKALCSISFDAEQIGLCPKTWSTSPGTVVYDISNSQYKDNPAVFEAQYCPKQRALKGKVDGVDRVATYKQSVNGQFNQRTSATFSQASPLYYHFSRYLGTTVDVPVAVMRTMDAQGHLHRVASKGRAMAQGTMIAAGWNVVTSAEKNPAGYLPINEFYYGDTSNDLLYGTLLRGPGARYGPEFNGNRSGGYAQEYVALRQTPAFLALAAQKPFADAVTSGVASSRKDPVVSKALGPTVSNEQMMFWMQELSEILILDYIFSQQDRPGNIDYLWEWYYVTADGKVKSVRASSEVARSGMASIPLPEEASSSSRHYLIQKTHINDNDAGGRVKYANFTKQYGLLQDIRHLNFGTYHQLAILAADFQARGPLYSYLLNTFYLPPAYVDRIAQNTAEAVGILQGICKAGSMRFDLDGEGYIATQTAREAQVNCQ